MKEIISYAEEFRMRYFRSPSTTEIAKKIGVSRGTAYKYLAEMAEKGMIRYDGSRIETEHTEKARIGMTKAAVLGSVSCGIPLLEEENIESYVNLPTELFGNGSFFVLRANGDSMTGAGIEDGDLVIVREAEDAEDGSVVVALLEDGSVTLKRLFRDQGHGEVRLHPENPDMQDLCVKNCRIQGVAVKVLKDIAR